MKSTMRFVTELALAALALTAIAFAYDWYFQVEDAWMKRMAFLMLWIYGIAVAASRSGMLITGVDNHDILQDDHGRKVHTFSESGWLWRWDPIFRDRHLVAAGSPF